MTARKPVDFDRYFFPTEVSVNLPKLQTSFFQYVFVYLLVLLFYMPFTALYLSLCECDCVYVCAFECVCVYVVQIHNFVLDKI